VLRFVVLRSHLRCPGLVLWQCWSGLVLRRRWQWLLRSHLRCSFELLQQGLRQWLRWLWQARLPSQVLQAFVLRSHLCRPGLVLWQRCSGLVLWQCRQRLLRSHLCRSFLLLCSIELLQGEVLQAVLARPLPLEVQELLPGLLCS